MAHPPMFDDDDPVLARVRAIALALPEAAEKITHGRPTFFTVKTFAFYGGSPRGEVGDRHDQALLFHPDPADEPALRQDPRIWEPSYLWPHGWLAIDLDDDTDWDALTVADLRGMAERRGLPLKARMTKGKLIKLLRGAS